MRTTRIFKSFFKSEKAGGIVLIVCTIISLILANGSLGIRYQAFWHQSLGGSSVEHWINDGLMTIFFLLIGLELEREVYIGELANFKEALFPFFAALGGMLVPAALFLLFNFGTSTQSGAGIPMSTDIAFALGVLSLLGKRVPASLKVFLTALAVIDDLGAILIIAIFYTQAIVWTNLFIALGIWLLLFLLGRFKVYYFLPYLLGGVLMWYFMLHSGVHATITGVLLAFAIPFGRGGAHSLSYRLQHFLHKPVAFIILPLFALANTAIPLSQDSFLSLTEHYTLGVALGLVLGKPIGIFLFAFLAHKAKVCRIPAELNWFNIAATGLLAGIGFTMSIFVTLLAYSQPEIIDNIKLSILLSSLVAGIFGLWMLQISLKSNRFPADF